MFTNSFYGSKINGSTTGEAIGRAFFDSLIQVGAQAFIGSIPGLSRSGEYLAQDKLDAVRAWLCKSLQEGAANAATIYLTKGMNSILYGDELDLDSINEEARIQFLVGAIVGAETNVGQLANYQGKNKVSVILNGNIYEIPIDDLYKLISTENLTTEKMSQFIQQYSTPKGALPIEVFIKDNPELKSATEKGLVDAVNSGIKEDTYLEYIERIKSEEMKNTKYTKEGIDYLNEYCSELSDSDLLLKFFNESGPNGKTENLLDYLKNAGDSDWNNASDRRKAKIIKSLMDNPDKIDNITNYRIKNQIEHSDLTILKMMDNFEKGYYDISLDELLKLKTQYYKSGDSVELKNIKDTITGENYTKYFPSADYFISDKGMIEYTTSLFDKATLIEYNNYISANQLNPNDIITLGKFLKGKSDSGNPVKIKTITFQSATEGANNFKKFGGNIGSDGNAIHNGFFAMSENDLVMLAEKYSNIFSYDSSTGQIKIYDYEAFGDEVLGGVTLDSKNGVYTIETESTLSSALSMPSISNGQAYLANNIPGGNLPTGAHEIVIPQISTNGNSSGTNGQSTYTINQIK